jgi:hypothetical protein
MGFGRQLEYGVSGKLDQNRQPQKTLARKEQRRASVSQL